VKRRRPSATARTLALAGLCASSLAAACGFVEVTYTDAGAGNQEASSSGGISTGEGSVGDEASGGNDGTVGSDAPMDAGTDTRSDAGVNPGVDSGMDTGAPPDAGHDAAQDTGAPPMDSSGISDGPNCDCAANRMLPTNLTCSSILGITCTGSGFAGSPACGTSANYYTCTNGTLQCTMQYEGPRTQECQ